MDLTCKNSPLAEKDVGITQYCGDHPGFFGIIKQRYSDFLVNELDPNGEEVHITDTNTILPVKLEVSDEGEKEDVASESQLPKGITEEIKAKINELGTSGSGSDCFKASGEKIAIPIEALSKEERKAVHFYIQCWHKACVSSTTEVDGAKVIVVYRGSASALKIDRKRREPRPAKYFTHFVLYKENMDTLEATNRIATKLRVNANTIGYAGTKDRRGKTVQRMSVCKVAPQVLVGATHQIGRLAVGNFSIRQQGITLGQLAGNAFKIVLREVKGDDSSIHAAFDNIKQKGFINYYGLQRFGTYGGHTHTIGKYLLCSQWKEAIDAILMPQASLSDSQLGKILKSFKEGKITATAALDEFKAAKCFGGIQTQLLIAISTLGENDALGALMRIPRNTRTLYLHAYQAFLWNRAVSRRLRQWGLRVLPGDLVACQPGVATDEQEIEVSDGRDPLEAAFRDGGKEHRLQACVRAIAPHEVDIFHISQVLVPSIGFAVKLPENDMGQWFRQMLQEDGLTVNALKHKQKNFAVSGAYRALIVNPKGIKHEIVHYTDPTEPLVDSDMDVIGKGGKYTQGQRAKTNCPPSDAARIENSILSTSTSAGPFPNSQDRNSGPVSAAPPSPGLATGGQCSSKGSSEARCLQEVAPGQTSSDCNTTNSPGNDTNVSVKGKDTIGPFKAVVVQFSLPPSCYATMVLRELLKIDTSSQFHANLNSTAKQSSCSSHGNKRPLEKFNQDEKKNPFSDTNKRPKWNKQQEV